MLQIQTFDARQGGNVIYKALAHPLAAEAIARLADKLRAAGPLAVFDPEGVAAPLYALHPEMPAPDAAFVQDVREVGKPLLGLEARPITELAQAAVKTVLIAAFEGGRI